MSDFKKTKKIKGMLIKILILLFSFLFFLWIYMIYSKIEVMDKTNVKPIVERTSYNATVNEIQEKSKTITDVIEDVNKSIVGISKIKDVGTSIFAQGTTTGLGIGTGFIVSSDGYIVTNEHVSGQRYSSCYVTLESGKSYNGTVVWSNSDSDLSIIKINMKGLNSIELGDSDELKIGENVYAIGNPVGYEFQRTVTSGIISAKDRTVKFKENEEEIYMADLIQTDATINPGNSGGPLIKPDGTVIGINSVKITSAEGIGFAVPINLIKPVVEKFINEGKFEEATLGIFAYDKNVIPYLDSNIKLDKGIYVAQIKKGSSAYQAKIKEKDIITQIDGIDINKMNDLKTYIYKKSPGEEVTLTIMRNKMLIDIKVKLGRK